MPKEELQKRVSIRSIKLAAKPGRMINEIIIEYQIHTPMEQYVRDGQGGHRKKNVQAILWEGICTIPIDFDSQEDIKITEALWSLKSIAEKKICDITNIPLSEEHPDNKIKD